MAVNKPNAIKDIKPNNGTKACLQARTAARRKKTGDLDRIRDSISKQFGAHPTTASQFGN